MAKGNPASVEVHFLRVSLQKGCSGTAMLIHRVATTGVAHPVEPRALDSWMALGPFDLIFP